MKQVFTILLITLMSALPLVVSAQDDPEWLDYEEGMVNGFVGDGNVVVISYTTEWCKACERQAELINRMRADNPDYDKMKFVRVDWDGFEKRAIVRNYDVFGRSTILVVQSGGEVANIFAETSRNVLNEALDAGLAAALILEASSVTN